MIGSFHQTLYKVYSTFWSKLIKSKRRRGKMEDLPLEIVTSITDKLNVKDLYAFRETQKNWADIILIDKVLEKKTIYFLQYFKDNLEMINGV